MKIIVNETERSFHLTNKEVSYLFRVMENGQLEQLYFGKRTDYLGNVNRLIERVSRPMTVSEPEGGTASSLETIKQEYPAFGSGDYHDPAFEMELENGSHIMDFRYMDFRTLEGKSKLPGLPATFSNNEDSATLEIRLRDNLTGAELFLNYTIFREYAAIARSARVVNNGSQTLTVKRMMSASLDLPDCAYDLIHLSGPWARERHIYRTALRPGIQSIGSTKGSGGHIHNPFFMLAGKNASEHQGEVYGFSLLYSGNFLGQAEVDAFETARAMIGIHPSKFKWILLPGETFQTPEAILVFSDQGFNKMSQALHGLFNNHLVRKEYAGSARPIVLNSWEGSHFSFDEEKIIKMAEKASELGIEMFVLDDGWFGKRDNDKTSLGDWFVNERKLPNGLGYLAARINGFGMKFGLWFEPEMASADSHIMREHPEWIIATPGRLMKQGRNQYVLDFTIQEVVDYVFSLIDKVLSSANIEYMKWDMNRPISEAYSSSLDASRQGEFFHRYILGVYKLYEKLLDKYPNLLIESCAAGGGRFDPGMLYYAPQAWTSDDTDAIERLKIQYGTSYAYPLSSMGNHVSSIPNRQVGRMAPFDTRANAAYFGIFGYELDPCDLTEKEAAEMKRQIDYYKAHRLLFINGDFYRLSSPFEGNESAWMTVDRKKEKAIVGWYQVLSRPNDAFRRIKLKGLEAKAVYHIKELDTAYTGSELMNMGLPLAPRKGESFRKRDFSSRIFTLIKWPMPGHWETNG